MAATTRAGMWLTMPTNARSKGSSDLDMAIWCRTVEQRAVSRNLLIRLPTSGGRPEPTALWLRWRSREKERAEITRWPAGADRRGAGHASYQRGSPINGRRATVGLHVSVSGCTSSADTRQNVFG